MVAQLTVSLRERRIELIALTFVAIGVENLPSLRKTLGSKGCDQALYQASRLLKSTFRGADALFRSGPAEFLIVMPDTSEEQADLALLRLRSSLDHRNAETDFGFELSCARNRLAYIGRSSDGCTRTCAPLYVPEFPEGELGLLGVHRPILNQSVLGFPSRSLGPQFQSFLAVTSTEIALELR
jgi:hypothetical protein